MVFKIDANTIIPPQLIRLQRIEHLALVPGIEDVNLKVIHLIRDPRGTMSSRLAFGTFYLDVSIFLGTTIIRFVNRSHIVGRFFDSP